jgi:hypothetical protein
MRSIGLRSAQQRFRSVMAGSSRALWLRAMCMLFTLLPVAHSWAQAQPAQDESRVKAAFLLRFVQYVEWPADARQPGGTSARIGVAGAPEVAAELLQAAPSRSVQGKALVVLPIKSPANVGTLHVLFIGNDERPKIAQYLNAVRDQPTLVVTEWESALEQGSMINFLVVDRRIKFEIALDTAERAGLTLSSRLLAVALRVHKGGLTPAQTLASCCSGALTPGRGASPGCCMRSTARRLGWT